MFVWVLQVRNSKALQHESYGLSKGGLGVSQFSGHPSDGGATPLYWQLSALLPISSR